MSISIEETHKKIVKDILSEVLQNGNIQVFVFGSRARGTHKKFADLDIALKSENVISQDIIDKLRISFNDSLLPYKVDIIDLNNIDEDFYNCIKSDLIQLL